MGFCFYGNVALAAKIAKQYVDRILIVDWDVHHGNGTEELVNGDPQILFYSIHRYDSGSFYPSTGHPNMDQNIINVGISSGEDVGDTQYVKIFNEHLKPIAQQFKPDLILVSCGFDAAEGDPLGGYNITPDGYYQMTKLLQKICPKLVLVLEGGYNLTSIANSMAACTKALLGTRD